MHRRYVFKGSGFEQVRYPIENIPFSTLHKDHKDGLLSVDALYSTQLYGSNLLDVPVPSYFKLLYTEVLHPFYIFQIFSIIIWLNDEYYIYAACICAMSVISAIVSVYQARQNRIMLAQMCHNEGFVEVLRRQSSTSEPVFVTIKISEIAPGDILAVTPDTQVPCDLILIQGICVVNESNLTGESVLVMKTPVSHQDHENFHEYIHSRHVLYSGTRLVQVKCGPDSVHNTIKASNQHWMTPNVALGFAFATGFSTSKGSLIQGILFPRSTRFKFYRESLRFVGVLGIVSVFGFIYTIVLFTIYESPIYSMVRRALDLVTIAVPPALPIAMTISTAFSVQRLKKDQIFCISPQRVNVAGRVNVMCFDKTGTLTEDHLDVFGALEVKKKKAEFKRNVKVDLTLCNKNLVHGFASCHTLGKHNDQYIGDPLEIKMFEAIKWNLKDDNDYQSSTIDGGNYPLGFDNSIENVTNNDNNMDNKAIEEGFSQVISGDGSETIEILKFFEFSNLLQRMSVIVNIKYSNGSSQLKVYCKGSPEMIFLLCTQNTVPLDYESMLKAFTYTGKRVLAFAGANLNYSISEAKRLTRINAERNLNFLGFFILQNQLKPDSALVIDKLNLGNVENIMITGDNEYTAINVASKCRILRPEERDCCYLLKLDVDESGKALGIKWIHVPSINDDDTQDSSQMNHLVLDLESTIMNNDVQCCYSNENGWENYNSVWAIDGKAFAYLKENDPQLFDRVLHKTRVYARMSPIDKKDVIVGLQKLNHVVGMCGDGANDLGALKAADVGLSLSGTEASIAAPFTSKIASIESVLTLLREGCCALSSSTQCYKYMACYSLIQFTTSLIIYSLGWDARLSDPQFMWIDIFLIFPLSFLMGHTGPRKTLSSRKPIGALISFSVIGSIASNIFINLIFQLCTFLWVKYVYLPEYMPEITGLDTQEILIGCLFLVANFQYISSCIAFSISKPFRKEPWTNTPFFISLIALNITCFLILMYPVNFICNLLSIRLYPITLRVHLLVFIVLNSIVSWCIELFLIISIVQPKETDLERAKLISNTRD